LHAAALSFLHFVSTWRRHWPKKGPDLLKSGGSGEDRGPRAPPPTHLCVSYRSVRERAIYTFVWQPIVYAVGAGAGQTIFDTVHAQGCGPPPNATARFGWEGREHRMCPKKSNLTTSRGPNRSSIRPNMPAAPIMIIDRELRQCFGEDLIFASDEDRAFDWLISLRRRNLGWKQARAQIVEYLRSRRASDSHIQKQVNRARPMLRKWLRD
jgi:hypothetical protein